MQQCLKANVHVTATTGIAATAIDGTTLFNLFQLNIKYFSSVEYGSYQYLYLRNLKYIIIDEFSMLELGLLEKIDECCRYVAYPS